MTKIGRQFQGNYYPNVDLPDMSVQDWLGHFVDFSLADRSRRELTAPTRYVESELGRDARILIVISWDLSFKLTWGDLISIIRDAGDILKHRWFPVDKKAVDIEVRQHGYWELTISLNLLEARPLKLRTGRFVLEGNILPQRTISCAEVLADLATAQSSVQQNVVRTYDGFVPEDFDEEVNPGDVLTTLYLCPDGAEPWPKFRYSEVAKAIDTLRAWTRRQQRCTSLVLEFSLRTGSGLSDVGFIKISDSRFQFSTQPANASANSSQAHGGIESIGKYSLSGNESII